MQEPRSLPSDFVLECANVIKRLNRAEPTFAEPPLKSRQPLVNPANFHFGGASTGLATINGRSTALLIWDFPLTKPAVMGFDDFLHSNPL
jgi:hypothetical protein